MRVLNDLWYLLEDEVEQVVKKGEISPTELDNIYKAVKTMYYTTTITAMKDYDGNKHRHNDRIAELEKLLENATNETERRSLREAIRAIEK